MKEFKIKYLLVAVALLFTACNDDFLEQPKTPAADGSEILFGGRAGFENNGKDSRTVYTGETYNYDNKKYERIDWIAGDKIEIYSPEASNGPSAHYNVIGFKQGDESEDDGTNKGSDYAYLESQGESSLQWNGDGNHTFYAMYPSSTMFNEVNEDGSVITVDQGVKLDKEIDENKKERIVVKGKVPISQNGIITEQGGNYTIEPNMDYAYMVAKEVANRKDNPQVGLTFVPIVTALEIEMKVPEYEGKDIYAVEMSEIRLEGKGIAGDFTADLTNWNPNVDGYPTCTNSEKVSYDYINISTWIKNLPITVAAGKTVKFTVFMRPGPDTDYSDLKVVIVPVGGRIAKTLPLTIKKNLKTRIKDFYLPAIYDEKQQFVVDNSKWMSQLPKTAKMKKLSLPGTGGSFSFKSSDDLGHYRSQYEHMDLTAQWNHGIRAFEIVTNRKNSTDNDISINDELIKCNGEELGGYDVQTVVKELLDKLAASYNAETDMYETAMLILTYQPEGSSPARNSGAYMTQVINYVSTLPTDRLIRYSPDLTLGEAQKCLMIVVRPTQKDEDDNNDWDDVTDALDGKTNADKILVIDGCGTAKDRWGSRGYKLTKQEFSADWSGKTYSLTHNLKAPDLSNGKDENSRYKTFLGLGSGTYYDYMEAYMESDLSYNLSSQSSFQMNPGQGDGKLTVTRGDMDFSFVTNGGFNCWYQEWQRVVEKNVYKAAGNWYDVNAKINHSHPAVYWFESYNEKLSNAKETLDMAISGEHNDKVFINSLCGYLANDDDDNNVNCLIPSLGYTYGGNGGNIKALADKLNVAFYQHVINRGIEQTSGPTGVILMDYVNNKKDDNLQYDGSYYLPSVIINNNFKYNLDVDDDDVDDDDDDDDDVIEVPDGGEG